MFSSFIVFSCLFIIVNIFMRSETNVENEANCTCLQWNSISIFISTAHHPCTTLTYLFMSELLIFHKSLVHKHDVFHCFKIRRDFNTIIQFWYGCKTLAMCWMKTSKLTYWRCTIPMEKLSQWTIDKFQSIPFWIPLKKKCFTEYEHFGVSLFW